MLAYSFVRKSLKWLQKLFFWLSCYDKFHSVQLGMDFTIAEAPEADKHTGRN
jgi:hypothetical protein